MSQIRIGKSRPGSASWRQEPLPADGRDSDIVHAHQIVRRTSCDRRRGDRQRQAPATAVHRQMNSSANSRLASSTGAGEKVSE